jgi:hypothetical protein
MDLDATERRIRRYLIGPCARDLRRLRTLAAGCDLVVADSLHPALIAGSVLPVDLPPVVHVVSEHIWDATVGTHDGRWPAPAARLWRTALEQLRARAHGTIVHAIGAPGDTRLAAGGPVRLPPIVAPVGEPTETAPARRRQLAVYLNPHYADPRIAEAVERAAEAGGYALVGVSERFAGRAGWAATHPAFTEVVLASDALVSGAGMGSLEQARLAEVPFVALMGDQPEQALNLRAFAARHGPGVAVVPVDAPDGLAAALAQLRPAAPAPERAARARAEIEEVHRLWADVLLTMLSTAKERRHGDRPKDRPADRGAGDRDREPPRGRRGARAPARVAREAAPAPRAPEPAAGSAR